MASPDHKRPPQTTPVYLKRDGDMPWPEDRFFFLLTASGLFQCRHHEFFTSCTPARSFPADLAEQSSFLEIRFPIIPRRLFELVVGFFSRIYDLHGSEAITILAWDRTRHQYRILVPEQEALVSRTWSGSVIALSVRYGIPPASSDLVPLVSIHSHADHDAYASATDKWDEEYRTGLHIVVGGITREPPDIQISAVVDGTRFNVRFEQIIGGYQHRRLSVPDTWIKRVRVECQGSGLETSYEANDNAN